MHTPLDRPMARASASGNCSSRLSFNPKTSKSLSPVEQRPRQPGRFCKASLNVVLWPCLRLMYKRTRTGALHRKADTLLVTTLMAMLAIALAALAASVLALPAVPLNARAAAPQVTIANGTVVGSSANGIDSFKGIVCVKVRVSL